MLFNVMVHVDADDEQHIQEVVDGWVLTAGAEIHNIASAQPLTVPRDDLPMVDHHGKVHQKLKVPDYVPSLDSDRPIPEPDDPVVARFSLIPSNPSKGVIVEFDGRASTGTGRIVSWAWDFGDGATDSGPRVSYGFIEKGDYVVSMVVTDEAEQTDEMQQTVRVT